MIVDNRITEYLHSLETSRGELLDTIEKKAIEDGVPIIRSETAALLRSLTAALRPENILEIGTAVGYSALQMCQVMPANCHITTIEKYEKRIPEAKENFRKAGEESRITFLEEHFPILTIAGIMPPSAARSYQKRHCSRALSVCGI